MSRAQQFIDAARQVAGGEDVRGVVGQTLQGMTGNRGSGGNDNYSMNPGDFSSARQSGGSSGTRIESETVNLDDAAERLSRSHFENGPNGPTHVITPMVMPRGRKLRAMMPVIFFAIVGAVGRVVTLPFDSLGPGLFGWHYWGLLVVFAAFMWWRQGLVMVPEGCTALISRFGKVEAEVGPGRVNLWNPWKRVSYIVNTTREYPFNAPIRQAPTKSGVQASVDLFLQFRIVNAREFVFVLGAVQGFQDKLNNAISETTRSLIYEQEASGIYDLVGESTQRLLEQLNAQFAPAVELTVANITHAEPSAQEYRMDLAAPEMVRVAKEAYTYEYELNLRKEQNEGDLNRDLANLNETLSAIQADIARYQAQMDTALERETNRANALARQRFVEAESTATANAALLEAQALDIQAMSAALAPEVLEYRYQQNMLDKLESLAQALPQIVRVGEGREGVDFLQIARELVGGSGDGAQLFTEADMQEIRSRHEEIASRIDEREADIAHLLEPPKETQVEIVPESDAEHDMGDERVEEIRRSVAGDINPQAHTEPEQGSAAAAETTAAPSAPAPVETGPAAAEGTSPEAPEGPGPVVDGPDASQRHQSGQYPQAQQQPPAPGEPEQQWPQQADSSDQWQQAAPPEDAQAPSPEGEAPPAPGTAAYFIQQARARAQQDVSGQDGENRE